MYALLTWALARYGRIPETLIIVRIKKGTSARAGTLTSALERVEPAEGQRGRGDVSFLHSEYGYMLMHLKELLLVSSSLQDISRGVYTKTHT
jgi:hypothetical protein